MCYVSPVRHTALFLLALGACDTSVGDTSPPDAYVHSALGPGMHLRDVQNPANNLAGQTVDVTGAAVITVDNFDETHDGKSHGTVFYEDADTPPDATKALYDGISAYESTFVPANLVLAPGDVVEIFGQYTQQSSIGTTVTFPAGQFLPQFYKPQVSLIFETPMLQPVVITPADLINKSADPTTFAHARQYLGMLVQIQNITLPFAPVGDGCANPTTSWPATGCTGRVHAELTTDTGSAELANELYNMLPSDFAGGTHFTSITGIVDYFYTFYLCPRSAADLVQ